MSWVKRSTASSPTMEVLDLERKGVSAIREPRKPKVLERDTEPVDELSELAAESAGEIGRAPPPPPDEEAKAEGMCTQEVEEGREAVEAEEEATTVDDDVVGTAVVVAAADVGEEMTSGLVVVTVASEGERGGGDATKRGESAAARCGEVTGVSGGDSGETTGVSCGEGPGEITTAGRESLAVAA